MLSLIYRVDHIDPSVIIEKVELVIMDAKDFS